MIGANEAEKMLDRDTLEQNRHQTLIDIALNNQSLDENEKELLRALKLKPFEMAFDFNHRTAIHDCIDFTQLVTPSKYREILIRFAIENYFESKFYPQILIGIFGLSLE